MTYLKIIFFLFVSTNLFSDSIDIDKKNQIELLQTSEIFIDKKRDHTIDKIVVSDDLFQKNDKNILSFWILSKF